jgi:hypothetical protein
MSAAQMWAGWLLATVLIGMIWGVVPMVAWVIVWIILIIGLLFIEAFR